jgi:protein-disulfide isomerase
MGFRPIISLALLLSALACKQQDAGGSPAAAQSLVVAQLNGRDISAAELETWMKNNLYEREVESKPAGEAYEAKTEAIEALLNELLVADAAKLAGQTSEAYLDAQVLALGPVTDAEVKAFFDENGSRLPPGSTLVDMAPRIKPHLEAQRPETVIKRLRAAAKVAVVLQPPRTNIEASGPSRGPADAPIVIISFSDYQCPYCKRVEPTVDEVLAKYPTQVRQVFRHLPLPMHPQARPAAIAAVCAEQQGKFWEYHRKLFENQTALADEDLGKYATAVGLDAKAFKACQASPEAALRVQVDADSARAAGITGTPAFFINGILLSGARPLEDFEKWIDQELAGEPQTPAPPAS